MVGSSIVLEDGTFLTTVGTAEGRTGIEVRDASGAVPATNDQCPGVHGEGTAENEVVVLGCEDGAPAYGGEITELDAPDQPYGRMGNAWVSETSPIVVGDDKDDRSRPGGARGDRESAQEVPEHSEEQIAPLVREARGE
ncbi:hypothetical protein SAMN06295924_101290 [Rathayibacter rathayi NCPPB 2980 = VKM Ac-1601]|uniref:hypothetical protein n=1 Tax=Rathayibacter rathayi TaxID=33887 RepID=UPI000BCC045E|nr:hypothetical protein [Rathayibacter rathayi]SOE02195.1 hypothetical protein SAMN06295924_101290 [Rathayibacter rathayi NCPPB 2980 = VKM Ac-1601]